MPEIWSVLLASCERPSGMWANLCPHVMRLTLAGDPEQRQWLMQTLQPHRIESLDGQVDGLLTGYYEPVLEARKIPGNGFPCLCTDRLRA